MTTKNQRQNPNLYEHYDPRHKRAARMLAHTLTLNDEAGWWTLAAFFSITLTPPELAGLSYACLMAQGADAALMTAEAAIFYTMRGGD